MKTYSPSKTAVKRNWHLLDAKDQVIGRLATQAAVFLMGKHKTDYVHHLDWGDHVVVINAASARVTGNKETQKVYTRHTGFPGGLRQITLEKLRIKKPEFIIEHAVSGMLPKNKLRDEMLKRLHVFVGDTHKYGQHFK